MPGRVEDIIGQGQISALGKAGYIVVPKNCVAPQLLGKAVRIDTGLPRADRELTAVRQAAAERAGMHVRDLIGPGQRRNFSQSRQIAMFVAVEHYGKTLVAVAMSLARSDHRTVMHGIAQVKAALKDPDRTEAFMERIDWVSARAAVLIREGRK